ncbi:MAG: response regulator [Methanomicrobiaceae archaeon]|nr:response regulator [Methanomicrobiaceae archaeon]
MYTILVVNDSPMVVDVLMAMLDRGGYHPVSAGSGEECLRLLKETKPDLILLDVKMRPLSGWETLRRIKDEPETRHIPVAMHTGKHLTPAEIQQYGGLIEDYILLPTTHRELFDVIEYILNKKVQIEQEVEIARRAGADVKLIEEFRYLSGSVDTFRRLIRLLELSLRTDVSIRIGEHLMNAIKSMTTSEKCMERRLEELKRQFHGMGRREGV